MLRRRILFGELVYVFQSEKGLQIRRTDLYLWFTNRQTTVIRSLRYSMKVILVLLEL